jgi:tyrosyl-tRNA synthetase
MNFKKVMAFEVVKMFKGIDAAEQARTHFEKTVQNKEIDEESITKVGSQGKFTMQFFLKVALPSESLSQIIRTIEQGGVEVNSVKITTPKQEIEFKVGDIVKYGKRKYFKVI